MIEYVDKTIRTEQKIREIAVLLRIPNKQSKKAKNKRDGSIAQNQKNMLRFKKIREMAVSLRIKKSKKYAQI